MKLYMITAMALLSMSILYGCGGETSAKSTNSTSVIQDPTAKNVLFVGNSYTFARVAPVLQYNSENISDLVAAFAVIDPSGTLSYEPHNWGGIAGIFKKLADQAGLKYNVSMSTRNAATLRGHFLNTASSWNLRGNIAKQKWDIVVLQAQSDEPLSALKSKNGNFVSFSTYLDQIERYIHVGAGAITTEAAIFGSLSNCTAATTAATPGAGFSASTCNTIQDIPANTNANPNAKVYLYQSWARPDMVEAHKCTNADSASSDGAPIADPNCDSTIYYTGKATTAANLNDMTTDLHNVFYGRAASNTNITGVAPVGDAFQRAVNNNLVKSGAFYKADGTYDDSGPINLWWKDRTHASVYGSYLSGLVMYGTITGLDPKIGIIDQVYKDLGISQADALMLQQVAHDTLVAAGTLAQ